MFAPLTRRIRHWHMRNVTRRKLAMLDNRLLSDLGTERDHIDAFVAGLSIEEDRK